MRLMGCGDDVTDPSKGEEDLECCAFDNKDVGGSMEDLSLSEIREREEVAMPTVLMGVKRSCEEEEGVCRAEGMEEMGVDEEMTELLEEKGNWFVSSLWGGCNGSLRPSFGE